VKPLDPCPWNLSGGLRQRTGDTSGHFSALSCACKSHVCYYTPVLGLPAGVRVCRFKGNRRHGPEGVGVEEGLWVYRGEWREDTR
jgi:hypothetical protein